MKKDFRVLLVLSATTRQHAELLQNAKKALAKQAQLSVLYVIPKIPILTQQLDMQEVLGQSVLSEVARILNLASNRLFMAKGPIKQVTNKFAKQLDVDQIIADSSDIEFEKKNSRCFCLSRLKQYARRLKHQKKVKMLPSIINALGRKLDLPSSLSKSTKSNRSIDQKN